MKVLVIEDDPGIVEVVSLCFQLRWSGASLISAERGAKGLECVESENPDVVILDIGLPDMDGYQVLREIRRFSDVPVIMLTNLTWLPGPEVPLAHGALDVWVKSEIKPKELVDRVNKFFGGKNSAAQ